MNLKAKVAAGLGVNMLFWLLMLLALAGSLCLFAALYLAIAPILGVAAGAALVGAGLLIVAGALGLAVYLAVKPATKSTAQQLRETPETGLEAQLRPVIGDKATDWTRDHTGTALVGALSAGVLLAASPGLRRTITRAVGPIVTRQAIRAFQRFSDN